ncbi:MAG: hypothetical protein ACK4PR_13695, partial [Gammaproteobacteria bacterium]
MQLRIINKNGKQEQVAIKEKMVYTAFPGDLLLLNDAAHATFVSINNQDLLITDEFGNSVLIKHFFTAINTTDGDVSIGMEGDQTYTASMIVSSMAYNLVDPQTINGLTLQPFQLTRLSENSSPTIFNSPLQSSAPNNQEIATSSANIVNDILANHELPTTTIITIPPPSIVNQQPVADNVSTSGLEDATSIPVTLTANDSDGTISSFSLTSLPVGGSLYVDSGLTTLAVAGINYAASANQLTFYYVPSAN